jgi:glucose-6-phosphate dehydrogenase assembly protein OpcA
MNPEKILHDLHELWDQLGREQQTGDGVLRACAMTLIVVAGGDADAEQVRRTVGVLMHDHPSRAIVLREHNGDRAELEARVFAECWMPFGGSRQICAEGVEIAAAMAQLNEVARFLVPLIVPDLPVVLWCRGDRAFSPGAFEPLFPLAGKIVFDSASAPRPEPAMDALKALRARGWRVADLAWTRLTGWREALANVFDEGLLPAAAVGSVRIAHGGQSPSASALYFAACAARAIPSARVTLEPAPGDPGLHAVTLSGAGAEICISAADATSVEVRVGTRACRSLLPSTAEDVLMREELSILGADPVFDSLMAAAA